MNIARSLFLFQFLFASAIFAQNVGINTDGSNPDGDAILHIKNDGASGKDSSVVRIENEQNGANDVTGLELFNSGTGTTAKWDVYIPASGSTDLRIKNNGTDRITIQNDGDVGIGTTSPVSGLDVQTSLGYAVETITGATTLNNTHNVILCNNGPYTVTLPPASTNSGKIYYLKNIDAQGDDITIDGNGSETIDASQTYILSSFQQSIRLISDGANWFLLDEAFKIEGTITGLTCGTITNNGDLTENNAAVGVSSVIPYTGGNGGSYPASSFTSSGVTGLTATLEAGSFVNGSDNLTFTITGTPIGFGTASFAITIGGDSCTITRDVAEEILTCSGAIFTWNDVISPNTGKTWMDRNLGASQVATSSNDADSYGDLFQWGRAADGHQCRSSATTTTLSTTDAPSHGDFITVGVDPKDWRNPQNDSLWQGVNGTNNPCPSGYRLPTKDEWWDEVSFTPLGAHIRTGSAFTSFLKLPMSGMRYSNGNITTNRGAFWSSTIDTDGRGVLVTAYSTSWGNIGYGYGSYHRADGLSIRCIKD